MVDETKQVAILVDVSTDHKNLECGQSFGKWVFVCTLVVYQIWWKSEYKKNYAMLSGGK